MSDSRFHLKIEFDIYGEKYKWEPSLNYFDRGDGMDDRIFSWFVDCYEKAYSKYQDSMHDRRIEQETDDEAQRERTELARLRTKYPDV